MEIRCRLYLFVALTNSPATFRLESIESLYRKLCVDATVCEASSSNSDAHMMTLFIVCR